jgi:hypothetical protein
MSKKQKGLIIAIVAVIIIGFLISKPTYVKTDIKIDSTEVKADTTSVLEKPIVR